MGESAVIQALKSACQVVVVDPCHTDYAHLLDDTISGDLSLSLLATGRAALRAASELKPDLWIINTCLPDMDGTDLFEMLNDRLDHVTVVLVADEYCPQTEIQVRRVGAPVFACKPLERSWLQFGVQQSMRRRCVATRSGMRAAG